MSNDYSSSYYPYHSNDSASAYPLGIMLFFGIASLLLIITFSWSAYYDQNGVYYSFGNNNSCYDDNGFGMRRGTFFGRNIQFWKDEDDKRDKKDEDKILPINPKKIEEVIIPVTPPKNIIQDKSTTQKALGQIMKPEWNRGLQLQNSDAHRAMMASVTIGSFLSSSSNHKNYY
jgi:hypothetical protein